MHVRKRIREPFCTSGENRRRLNRDIWHPFHSSYAAGDAEAFLRLYTEDLIGAGGPAAEVYGWPRYAAETTEWFATLRERHYRIDAPGGRVFFGRFHTFARKDDGGVAHRGRRRHGTVRLSRVEGGARRPRDAAHRASSP